MPIKKTTEKLGRIAAKKARSSPRAAKATAANSKWNGISSEAVERATGKPWNDWLKLLDKDGAAKLPHKEIATHIRAKYGVGDWWCQMVTVGYEQARGLRVKHQTATGYIANISKTFPVSMQTAFDAVADTKQRSRWLEDSLTISKATRAKSVRMTNKDDSRVVFGFWDKTGKAGITKTSVVVQHEKLKNAASVSKSKKYWAARLAKLGEVLGV